MAGGPFGPEARPKGGDSALPFLLSAVAMLLVAGMMRHMFGMSGITTPVKGGVSGLGVGAFFFAPWIMPNHAYTDRPMMRTAIDSGYAVFGCGIIGVILTLL